MNKTFFLILLLLFISGCSQKKDENISLDDTVTQYEKDTLFEIVNEEQNTLTISGESSQQFAEDMQEKSKDYLEVQANFEYVKYDAANRYRSADSEKNMQSLFCVDKDTGVVYFVNRDKDWYIYRLYNETVELVVELPARNLYIVNGILYFIVEDYDKYELEEISAGDIYAYSIVDRSVHKILDADVLEGQVYCMIPYEDGLALDCRKFLELNADGSKTARITLDFYSFDNEKIETDPYKRACLGWGDFYLQTTRIDGVWKTVLRNRINDEINAIEVPATESFIIENDWYAFDKQQIYITNLLTGTQQVFNCRTMFQELVPEHASKIIGEISLIDAFTVTRDYMWAVLLHKYLLRINPETGEAVCYLFATDEHAVSDIKFESGICDLYTDGINLYAVYSPGETTWNSGVLVYVDTKEVMGWQEFYNLPVLKLEYLTEGR